MNSIFKWICCYIWNTYIWDIASDNGGIFCKFTEDILEKRKYGY